MIYKQKKKRGCNRQVGNDSKCKKFINKNQIKKNEYLIEYYFRFLYIEWIHFDRYLYSFYFEI